MSAVRTIVMVGLAALLFCCEPGAPDPPKRKPAALQSADVASQSKIGRTTSPHIAIKNLNAQIEQAERVLKTRPGDLAAHGKAVSLYLGRSSRLGRLVDLDRAMELSQQALEMAPKKGDAYLIRARALSSVHRFAEALPLFDKAEELGVDAFTLASPRAAVLLGLGKFDEALAMAQEIRKRRPKTGALGFHAAVLGKMGKYAEADAIFAEAEANYHGVSAFEVAWLYFEWGAMWDRAGQGKKAKNKYQLAVNRLPQYAHAIGHLANFAKPAVAESLFRKIMETSDDPEYVAGLSWTLEKQKPGSGVEMLAKAKAGYVALMKKYPLAFADHAGWFYLEIAKQPDRALEVAELNFANRKIPEAYELMIAALMGTGDSAGACEMAEEALDKKYPSRGVKLFAADAYDACGKKDRAAELRKEAKNAARQ